MESPPSPASAPRPSGDRSASRRATGGKESAAETRLGWKMAGMGFQVASEVAAGVLLGWLFDRWRGVPGGNIGVIVGASVGILVGLWSLIRNAVKLNRELDKVSPKRERVEIKPDEPFVEAGWDDDDDEGQDLDQDKDDWNKAPPR